MKSAQDFRFRYHETLGCPVDADSALVPVVLFYGRFGLKNADHRPLKAAWAGLREPERGCVVLS